MKIMKMLKFSGLAALILSVAVGCASAPKEEPAADPMAEAQAAIQAAKDKIAEAEAADYVWRDTADILAAAEKAYKEGDYDKAIQWANMAREQAEDALAQKAREEQRMKEMFGDSQAPMDDHYMVERGDSLWGISGKSQVYGNPYQWPLIYKANQDKIKDADLIYPGQRFAIERGVSAADIDAAVHHAKTRGAWSIGTVESSDKAYLSR